MSSRKSGTRIILCVVTAVVCVLLVQGWRAQGGAKAAPSDAPEMERLAKWYVGDWEYTETYAKTPMTPEGAVNTGLYHSEPGPGGNSLVNRFHSKGPAGDFEGLLIMTWDPKEKAYKNYVFGNDFPGAVITIGHFEGDALVFRGEFEADGSKMVLRISTKVDEQGRLISEEFVTLPGKPEALFVRVEAKRKK